MSYILRHQGVMLAYSWTRPAILAAGKDRGECLYFFCFFTFIQFLFFFHPCLFVSSPLLSLLSIFSLSLGDNKKLPTRVDVSLNPNTINQSGQNV